VVGGLPIVIGVILGGTGGAAPEQVLSYAHQIKRCEEPD